ncbi:unnamed protein product [Phytophthora fragariaefolia]|uniref:Unnamed protein product n=1 Tax=Phytophthora fragariaefolia TaxID=1490495 RepID=A0A9W6XSX2_9STRA|nr:unnamed protein product [Phytophthora fragariaefolia]
MHPKPETRAGIASEVSGSARGCIPAGTCNFLSVGTRAMKDYMHTFMIPLDLTKTLQAAITTAWHEQREPDELEACVKAQGLAFDLVASIGPKLWRFNGYGFFI